MIYSQKTGSAINESSGGLTEKELESAAKKYQDVSLGQIKDPDMIKDSDHTIGGKNNYVIKPEEITSKFTADAKICADAKKDLATAQKNKSIFNINNEAYAALDLSDIERSDEFKEIMYEYMDLEDDTTKKVMFALNEAEQDRMGVSLTSRLYEAIIDRVDDIDFGEIPRTRGDITKLPNYSSLKECHALMTSTLKHFKEGEAPIRTLATALSNIESRTKLWTRAYGLNVEFPMVIYNTMVLAIVQATAYMISMCVDYIKSPTAEKFDIVIDRSALNKSKDHMVFDSLDKFNAACANGSVDKAIDACLRENVKNFSGSVLALSSVGAIVVLLSIIPIIKELVFLFYYSRVKVADYFEAQSSLLEMNAYNLESGQTLVKTGQDARKVAEKQVNIAGKFRKIAEKIAVDNKSAESKATKEIVNDRKKFKADDVIDQAPDAMTSALF